MMDTAANIDGSPRRFTKGHGVTGAGLRIPFVTLTSGGIKPEGAELRWFPTQEKAKEAFDAELDHYQARNPGTLYWRSFPEMILDTNHGGYSIYSRVVASVATLYDPTSAITVVQQTPKGAFGWRASKGPQDSNKTGFRATGHRLLPEPEPVETATESGIILTKKVIDQDKSKGVWLTVIEIGHDAWSDKSTDFCDVGDKVLVGEYTGKFHTSLADGKEYRFVNDLDIITPLVTF